ncbi:Z1 domain-containing protein [Paenibacillus dakarensis]|uniref:Z1 domain-containing protein n=1 Tax=Paenibacillus dakarensis TaxID=1527293 RepID=UPI0006D58448|nr:Z1 domain-containing protein [Paenibacillus dakarensis]
MNDARKLFEQTFATNYMNFKSIFPSQENAAERALEFAKLVIQGENIEKDLIEEWSFEMYRKYNVGFEIIKTPVLRSEEEEDWYSPKLLVGAFFWTRYRDYLIRVKNWSQDAVASIDDSTNEIMRSLGNPEDINPFDKRGLVLGYVQSGKTANFTGLINKAFDLGYKLIIVFSGMHNDLRAQTQLRLEEEVIGSRVDKFGNSVGVSQIHANTPNHIISSWTTVERDISSEPSGIFNLNQKTLMVVKKNSIVLESLKNQLDYQKKLFKLDIPVLIIDDEADQASVDTSKGEDPKKINKLIRQILEVFDRRCYVGYTATPFANLLISAEAKTEDEGKDLYPKDFLVGLPKPKGYCGPEEFFNVEEDANDTRPSLIRPLNEADIEVFTGIKTKGDADKFDEVPPQMKESILAFLLTIAVRDLRGQRNKHNSMLIHTSRFKDVQSSVKDSVEQVFAEIYSQIQYNQNGEIVKEIRNLYEKDVIPTSKEWPGKNQVFSWEEVYQELRESSKKVEVFEINGNSKDALDYHQYKEDGLNVIAVGGDKLSRGLTLEGLSVTYYFRNSLMYDTLMQMGRWFGYRNGYMDLCRIYTTTEIASKFEHLAIAMIELRKEFENLAKLKKTPLEYAIKMLSHPTMTLTSPLKMKNASITNVNYKQTLQQTRIFDNKESFFSHNMRVTENLINELSGKFKRTRIGSGKTGYYIAQGIDVDKVLTFLSDYKTSNDADKVDSIKIINYIRRVNDIEELLDWTVVVVEGDPSDKSGLQRFPVRIGTLEVNSAVVRGVNATGTSIRERDKIDIRAIVASRQEFIDLDQDKIRNLKDKQEIRRLRPKKKGMLLIYPLHPQVKIFQNLGFAFNENMVPIGIAISFPDSDLDDSNIYEVNKTIK